MVKSKPRGDSDAKKFRKAARDGPQSKGNARQPTKAAPVYGDESDEDENYMAFAGNNENDDDDDSAGEGDKAVFDLNLHDNVRETFIIFAHAAHK